MTIDSHNDIKGDALTPGEHVVFCQAGSCKLMSLGWVNRVLPKTIEVAYQQYNTRSRKMETHYVFRDPANVCRIEPKVAPVEVGA